MSEMLRIEHHSVSFEGLKALDDVSLTVSDNGIFGLLGPNGAGKTTFFNAITGFTTPTGGSVHFFGKDVTKLNATAHCEEGMARTFQNIRVFGQMTVLENVLVGMHKNFKTNVFGIFLKLGAQKKEEKEAVEKAQEILDFLEIGDTAYEIAGSLPYGTQRKVEIARALASDPRMLLLDEPTAGMNEQEKDDLMMLIDEIRRRGTAIIVIEHNIKFMLSLCDQIAVLDFGKLIALDKPEKVANDPQVIEAYIGSEEE